MLKGLLSQIITDETGVNQGGPNSPDTFVDFLSAMRILGAFIFLFGIDEKCGIVVDEYIVLHLLWAVNRIILSNLK